MELIYYGRWLRRNAVLILLVGVVTAGAAAIAAARDSEQYKSQNSLLLSRTAGPPTTDYDFDQFYLLQATEIYAGNIVSWLNGAGVTKSIKAQAAVSDGQVRGRKSGGTIELTGQAGRPEQAQALVGTATKFVTERTKTLSSAGGRPGYDITVSPLGDSTVKPSPLRSAALGFVAGILLGLVLALLRQGLRRKQTYGPAAARARR